MPDTPLPPKPAPPPLDLVQNPPSPTAPLPDVTTPEGVTAFINEMAAHEVCETALLALGHAHALAAKHAAEPLGLHALLIVRRVTTEFSFRHPEVLPLSPGQYPVALRTQFIARVSEALKAHGIPGEVVTVPAPGPRAPDGAPNPGSN